MAGAKLGVAIIIVGADEGAGIIAIGAALGAAMAMPGELGVIIIIGAAAGAIMACAGGAAVIAGAACSMYGAVARSSSMRALRRER